MKKFFLYISFISFHCVFPQEASVDTSYSETGKIRSITYMNKGEKEKVVEFYDNENVKVEYNFKNNVKHGLTIYYDLYLNRVITQTRNYENGVVSGPVTGYYFGKVSWQCFYKNGDKDSIYTTFYQNGNKKQVVSYKSGRIDGKLTTYYINGNPSYITFYKEGKINGSEAFFYENGKPSMESFKINGKRDGLLKLYYENGNLKYTAGFKDDKMFGERLCYNENGTLANGNFVTYEKGIVDRECKCINGKPEGELKYYSDGQLVLVANFKDGKPDGLTYYYSKYGNVISSELYKNGVYASEEDLDTPSKLYDPKNIYDLPDKESKNNRMKDKLILAPK